MLWHISENRTDVIMKFKHILWLELTVQACLVPPVVANKPIMIKAVTEQTGHQGSLSFRLEGGTAPPHGPSEGPAQSRAAERGGGRRRVQRGD